MGVTPRVMFNASSACAADTNRVDNTPAKAADKRPDNLLKVIIFPLNHALPTASILSGGVKNTGLQKIKKYTLGNATQTARKISHGLYSLSIETLAHPSRNY